ncbi:hypothetical protein ABZX12_00710 [Kribbella sp. NPDC003505]|uniref:hypothetical protein n=1 Tax=Kribbella sp. NPDC003505 TaxID=3154448 RepID=UPI00339FD1AA
MRSTVGVPAASARPEASPGPTRTTAASPSESATSPAEVAAWKRTLEALDAERAKAFWTLDLDALDRIYVPGSPPWVRDRALLAEYREQNIRVEGLRITIDSTAVTRRTATSVTLKVTDRLTAGQAIDASGTVTTLPSGIPTTTLITMTSTPGRSATPSRAHSRSSEREPKAGWRISTIIQP